jgi:RimJ/RimL family protein N-acetyltransferase
VPLRLQRDLERRLSADVPRIETGRLVLRGWHRADLGPYQRMLDDPAVMRFMGAGAKYRVKRVVARLVSRVSTLEAARDLVRRAERWREQGWGDWALELKHTGELIGRAGFERLPDWTADETDVELGWLLAQSAWGQGLATEAAHAALQFGFANPRFTRLVSTAFPEHQRSIRVMERLGFSYQGRTRWRGHEMVWYAMDRAQWLRGPDDPAQPAAAS